MTEHQQLTFTEMTGTVEASTRTRTSTTEIIREDEYQMIADDFLDIDTTEMTENKEDSVQGLRSLKDDQTCCI